MVGSTVFVIEMNDGEQTDMKDSPAVQCSLVAEVDVLYPILQNANGLN